MKKLLFVFGGCIFLFALTFLAGCSSGNSTPPPAIAVDLSPSSAQALDVSQSDSFTATVSNDSSNQGVNWTVACPEGVNTCEAMAQTKSASGAQNKYNAPANVSAAETVTIIAASVSDPTKFKSVSVTVNPALALVNPPPAQPQPGAVGQPFSLNLMKFVQGGTPPFTWTIGSGTLPAGLTLDASTGMVAGTPSATATAVVIAFNCADSGNPPTTLTADLQISLTVNPAGGSGFKAIGSMAIARVFHTATLLSDGKVLICGGRDNQTLGLDTAEIFDPSTGKFSPTTGNMNSGRYGHTATLLDNGKVLIAGGDYNGTDLTTVEIFDPKTGMFSPTQNMSVSRNSFTATRLLDGRILVAGGIDATDHSQVTAELFEPKTDQFTPTTGPMTAARAGHVAALLGNGKVLLTGGAGTALGDLFDPASNTFTSTRDGGTEADGLTATSLQNGKVLVSGGRVFVLVSVGIRCCLKAESLAIANLFDSNSESFAATGHMVNARSWHTATLLNDGKLLVAGGGYYDFVNGRNGWHSLLVPVASAELYDPISASFVATANMASARASHTAILLKDGTVLVTGGYDANLNILATAELFQ